VGEDVLLYNLPVPSQGADKNIRWGQKQKQKEQQREREEQTTY